MKRIWIPSPNYSSRGNSSVRLIVLHTAEGSRTYQSLGNFFASPSSGVSSHVGIDDTPNTVGEYVVRGNKAWTQGNANPIAVSAELCAFAAWSVTEWMNHPVMLTNVAAWLAEEASKFQIPLVRLTPAQAQGSGIGVCEHVDLGSWGGGHTDCGPNFPIDDVIAVAKGSLPEKKGMSVGMFIKYQNKIWQQCPVGTGNGWYWRQVPKAPTNYPVEDDDGTFFNMWQHQESGKLVNP